MRSLFLVILLFSAIPTLCSQDTLLIFLKDKSGSSQITFSDKSEERRLRNHVLPDEKDLSISAVYMSELEQNGRIIQKSRWLNAVLLETSENEQELILNHDFIKKIINFRNSENTVNKSLDFLYSDKSFNYGVADTQILQINLDCLHTSGYSGDKVLLAVIDAGFSGMDTISYFNNLFTEGRIKDQFNFIDNSSSVYGLSSHGTAVSSCISAESTNSFAYVGTAPHVDLALYVSEDVNSETLIEEFYLVLALERCDSIGVDIANISLGYTDFDDPSENHTYSDLDGQTTIAAQGVNIATSKGILVIAAAGNSGPDTIGTPCDADGCLCVGGVDGQNNYAFFSSVGPSFDAQIKPDISARAIQTWVVMDNGQIIQGNGTSFATPIISGASACLLQAHPNTTVQEMKSAIRESSSQFFTPDSLLGYGIPDFCKASNILLLNELNSNIVGIYPNPANNELKIVLSTSNAEAVLIDWYDLSGKQIELSPITQFHNFITFDLTSVSSGIYALSIKSEDSRSYHKIMIVH